MKKYLVDIALHEYNYCLPLSDETYLNSTLEEYKDTFLNQEYICENYTGEERRFLLSLLASSQLNISVDEYTNKLLMEKISSKYVFADYHEAMIHYSTNLSMLKEIENQKNLVLKKYDLDYQNLKANCDEIYQKIFGKSYIEHYEEMNAFCYPDYLSDAQEMLESTHDEYCWYMRKLDLLNKPKYVLQSILGQISSQCIIPEESFERVSKDFIQSQNNIKINYFDDTFGFYNWGAISIPIRIPEDIRVIIYSTKNLTKQLQYLLHEMGHAISFSNIDESLPFINRYSYNEIMQEAFARIFEELVYNPFFCQKYKLILDDDISKLSKFESIYKKRLYAAKYQYHAEFFVKSDIEYLQNKYKRIMENSLFLSFEKETYSIDADIGRPSAQFFISRIISKDIGDMLISKYDINWFEKSEAMNYLRHLWRQGNLLTPKNYLRELGEK